MADCLAEIKQGTPNCCIWAQGTWRAGEHYGVKRIPVIKKQAISAYDQRVVEATGITMMSTARARTTPRAPQDARDGGARHRRAERGPPGAHRRQRLAVHLRHERDHTQLRVHHQCHQCRPRHEPDAGNSSTRWAATVRPSTSSTAWPASRRRTTQLPEFFYTRPAADHLCGASTRGGCTRAYPPNRARAMIGAISAPLAPAAGMPRNVRDDGADELSLAGPRHGPALPRREYASRAAGPFSSL